MAVSFWDMVSMEAGEMGAEFSGSGISERGCCPVEGVEGHISVFAILSAADVAGLYEAVAASVLVTRRGRRRVVSSMANFSE
jgi:hypothetical protein